MMLYYIKGAVPSEYVRHGEPCTVDGVQYPAGWDLSTLGKEVAFADRPNDRFYDVREVYNGAAVTYDVTPRDLGELKAREVAAIKATAGALLAPSDWRVIRASEGVKPLDEATAAYREAVRAASNVREEAILACASVDELAALPVIEWPEAL